MTLYSITITGLMLPECVGAEMLLGAEIITGIPGDCKFGSIEGGATRYGVGKAG